MIQTQLGTRKLNDIFAEQSRQGIESHRRQADGVQVENIPRIHDVKLEEFQKMDGRYTV